jgi:hypothetical protein
MRWKWLCSLLGHPNALVVFEEAYNEMEEWHCPDCNMRWSAIKDGVMPRPEELRKK